MIPVSIMRYGILSNYETRVVNVRTSEAQTQLRILANHLITYNYLKNPDSVIVNAELAQFSSFYDGRVLIIDDALRIVKDTYDMSAGKARSLSHRMSSGVFETEARLFHQTMSGKTAILK